MSLIRARKSRIDLRVLMEKEDILDKHQAALFKVEPTTDDMRCNGGVDILLVQRSRRSH